MLISLREYLKFKEIHMRTNLAPPKAEVRGFESLRARQSIKVRSGDIGYTSYRETRITL
jgi:hypothetical protein